MFWFHQWKYIHKNVLSKCILGSEVNLAFVHIARKESSTGMENKEVWFLVHFFMDTFWLRSLEDTWLAGKFLDDTFFIVEVS